MPHATVASVRGGVVEMQLVVVLMLLPMFIYCSVQAYRDLSRRHWVFAAWGVGTVLYIGWIIEELTRTSSY